MKRIIIALIIISLGVESKTQDLGNFNKQKREFVFANIGISGFVGGIGALVNKRKNENTLKVFAKGLWQGCLGGTFQVLGKELTYQIKAKENISYAWMARITNSIGNSITQNAASNINFWERWHFNLGVIRFDYNISDKMFQARLFPSSIYGVMVAGSQAKFNLKKTLETGMLIYEKDGPISTLGRQASGIGIVSSIAIDKNVQGKAYYSLVAHETMHILQYDNLVWINPMLNKFDEKWKNRSVFYKKMSKYIYFDFNGLTDYALYSTQKNQDWICRFLEREAEHFSQRETLPKCH